MYQVNQNGSAPMNSYLDNDTKRDVSMTDQEALSALMDGELSEFELRRLLTRISQVPELLETWERYNLARAVFEPEPLNLHAFSERNNPRVSNSLLDRIMVAVEQEPLPDSKARELHASNKSPIKSWHSSVARLAIAASVALAVFVGMQSLMTSISNQPEIAEAGSTTEHQNVQLAVDEEAQQRLNDYIRSVSIPSRADSTAPFNILDESAMLRPVSDRELIKEVERPNP